MQEKATLLQKSEGVAFLYSKINPEGDSGGNR